MPRFTEKEKAFISDKLLAEGEKLFSLHGLKKVTVDDLADLVRLRPDLVFILGLRLGEHLPGVEDILVVRFRESGGLGDKLVGHARFAQVSLSEELGVAAQHDVLVLFYMAGAGL